MSMYPVTTLPLFCSFTRVGSGTLECCVAGVCPLGQAGWRQAVCPCVCVWLLVIIGCVWLWLDCIPEH